MGSLIFFFLREKNAVEGRNSQHITINYTMATEEQPAGGCHSALTAHMP
jgi:hypothetical protein